MKISVDKRGLTLIEMLVSIAITIILLGSLSMFIIRSFQLNKYAIEQGLNSSVMQNAMHSFSANLREARQGEEGSYLLNDCQDYEITFFSDIDNDDVVEKLTYYLNNGQLILQIIEPDMGVNPPSYDTGSGSARVIGAGVVNETLSEPLFYYYEEDGTTPLAAGFDSSQVELVRLKIFVNVDIEEAPDSMQLETMIRPRNIP